MCSHDHGALFRRQSPQTLDLIGGQRERLLYEHVAAGGQHLRRNRLVQVVWQADHVGIGGVGSERILDGRERRGSIRSRQRFRKVIVDVDDGTQSRKPVKGGRSLRVASANASRTDHRN